MLCHLHQVVRGRPQNRFRNMRWQVQIFNSNSYKLHTILVNSMAILVYYPENIELGLAAEVSAAPWPLGVWAFPWISASDRMRDWSVSDWDDDAGDKLHGKLCRGGFSRGPIFWTYTISDHFHATSKRPCEVVSHIFEETPPNQSSWIPQLRGRVRFRFLIAMVTWFILDALRKRLCLGYWNMSVQIRNIQITMKHTWVIMNLNSGFPSMY